jgi:hypothetical protein
MLSIFCMYSNASSTSPLPYRGRILNTVCIQHTTTLVSSATAVPVLLYYGSSTVRYTLYWGTMYYQYLVPGIVVRRR